MLGLLFLLGYCASFFVVLEALFSQKTTDSP